MYAALRVHAPVHHVDDGDYWVLSRFTDVLSAVRDDTTFSSADGLTFNYGERERAGLSETAPMVMIDPPEHTAFRRLVSKRFTPRAVAGLEDQIRSFVVERLERMPGGSDDEFDTIAALFKPLASMVVAQFLGAPPADRVRFDRWTEAIVAANAGGDALRAADAVSELDEPGAGCRPHDHHRGRAPRREDPEGNEGDHALRLGEP